MACWFAAKKMVLVSWVQILSAVYVHLVLILLEKKHEFICSYIVWLGGTHGVMDIFVENGYGNLSSNPGLDCLHFT